MHLRLLDWWTDDPLAPGRATLEDPDVRRLIHEIAPQALATDLGGVMSLNARLEPGGWVLRVHQPFVSRARLLAVQEVRLGVARRGLLVAPPARWDGTTVFRCGAYWAELEAYLPNKKPPPSPQAYTWLFSALGCLHRALAKIDAGVPRPVVATYGPPATLARWLLFTEAAVQSNSGARDTVVRLRDLVRRLRQQWVTASQLPTQLVHGDARLGNFCRAQDGATVYFDFGFLAQRPRVHDLAYGLAYMVLALNGRRPPGEFRWSRVERVVAAYETAAGWHLTPAEKKALGPSMAAVPIYHAAIAGFTKNPIQQLRSALPFVQLSEWLVEHPSAVSG